MRHATLIALLSCTVAACTVDIPDYGPAGSEPLAETDDVRRVEPDPSALDSSVTETTDSEPATAVVDDTTALAEQTTDTATDTASDAGSTVTETADDVVPDADPEDEPEEELEVISPRTDDELVPVAEPEEEEEEDVVEPEPEPEPEPEVCVPACDGVACGPDGCGGECGSCGPNAVCTIDQQCVTTCMPDCSGAECGDDGCGGSCGTCGDSAACVGQQCVEPVAECEPSCDGLECGDDGCGGTCGDCGSGEACVDSMCVLDSNCGTEPSCECMFSDCSDEYASFASAMCGLLPAECKQAMTDTYLTLGCEVATCDGTAFPGLSALCDAPECGEILEMLGGVTGDICGGCEEVEPNDAPQDANYVEFTGDTMCMVGTLAPCSAFDGSNELDRFEFTAPQDGSLTVTLTWEGSADLDKLLSDPTTGASLITYVDGPDTSETGSADVIAGTTYLATAGCWDSDTERTYELCLTY